MAGLAHRRRAAPGAGPQAGFTLLEMLVAVAILAVLVSIIPRSFVYARAIINRSESWTEARLVADAVLNGELASAQLTAGTLSGVVSGRQWVATLERNAALNNAGDETPRVLLDVKLQVSVSPQDTLEIDTMRIGTGQ